MTGYTGKERVSLAYNRPCADRVPIDIQGLNTGHLPISSSSIQGVAGQYYICMHVVFMTILLIITARYGPRISIPNCYEQRL